MNYTKVEASLRTIFKAVAGHGAAATPIPGPTQTGKLYELYALAYQLGFKSLRGWRFAFIAGSSGAFRGAPGPMSRTYNHFAFRRPSATAGQAARGRVWTDIEYVQYGAVPQTTAAVPSALRDMRHELDILFTMDVASGYPCPPAIIEGTECKYRRVSKANFREMISHRVNTTADMGTRLGIVTGGRLSPGSPKLQLWTIDPAARRSWINLRRYWRIGVRHLVP